MIRRILATLGLGRYRQLGANRATDLDARVIDVKGTGESVPAVVIVVRFRNRSGDTLAIESYQIEWPGGRFTVTPRDLRVARHGELERTARLEPRHGDIARLLARSDRAKVRILRARAVPTT